MRRALVCVLFVVAVGPIGYGVSQSTDGSGHAHADAPKTDEVAEPTKSGAKVKPKLAAIPLPVGEQLIYQGTVRKAGVTVDVGKATFTVTKNDEKRTVLTACAKGEKFGYSLLTRVTSTLNEDGSRPALYHYFQRGSEEREKKLHFGDDGSARYEREKHCMEPDCKIRAHYILQRSTFGKDEFVHCPDRDCRLPQHLHWKTRHNHELEHRHFDMLSAVYYARTLNMKPGDPAIEVPVINDHDRWIVKAEARLGGRIKVPAGVFQTYKLTLEPRPAPGSKPKERFKGLFGLNGTIHIWIDSEHKRPVLVQGKLPFAFMDLFARVELESISETEKPAELPAQ